MLKPDNEQIFIPHLIFFTFGVTAYLSTILSPVLLGGLNQEGAITLAQMGYISTIELIATGLASMLAPRMLPGSPIRAIGFLAAVISAFANLTSIKLVGNALILPRLVAGIADGVLIAILFEHVSRAAKPDRLVGIFYFVLVLAAFLATLGVTDYVVPILGVHGVFAGLAALCGVSALLAWQAPKTFPPRALVGVLDKPKNRMPLAAVLIVVNVFLFNAFTGIVWVYWGPIAGLSGLTGELSGTMSAISLAAQLGGMLTAVLIASKVPQFSVAIVAHAAAVVCIGYAISGPGKVGFLVFALIFGFVMYFVAPFAASLVSITDSTNKGIPMLAPAILLGTAVGPMIASLLVSDTDVRRGVAVAAILCAGALVALVSAKVSHFKLALRGKADTTGTAS